MSFATKRIGTTCCTLFTFTFCHLLPIILSQNYLLPIISVLAENTLLKTAYHFLLLLVGFDTLTYRKDYDRSLTLVGHQPYHIQTCPAKTSYTSSTLLLQVLRGCYGLLTSTVLTYGSKTTTVIYQVCCFNLQQGPAAVKFDSTKARERDTCQPPLCKQVARNG